MSKKRIALIGGGQIGGNLALLAAQKELGDIIIFDILKAEGMVKGKALDLMQLRPHDGHYVLKVKLSLGIFFSDRSINHLPKLPWGSVSITATLKL